MWHKVRFKWGVYYSRTFPLFAIPYSFFINFIFLNASLILIRLPPPFFFFFCTPFILQHLFFFFRLATQFVSNFIVTIICCDATYAHDQYRSCSGRFKKYHIPATAALSCQLPLLFIIHRYLRLSVHSFSDTCLILKTWIKKCFRFPL